MAVKRYEVAIDDGSEHHSNFTLWVKSREAAIQETTEILKSMYKEMTFEVATAICPTRVIGKDLSGETQPYSLHDVVATITFGGEAY